MASNLRIGGTNAYQPYLEVEPISASHRIDSHHAQDEQRQQKERSKPNPNENNLRRFVSMRKLIDSITQVTDITRVDYNTTQSELKDLGLALLEKELIEQLLQFKIPLDDIDSLLQQIRQQVSIPSLEGGEHLTIENNFLPIFIAGVSEYNLCFKQLHLAQVPDTTHIGESLDIIGRYIELKNRIRLDFIQAPEDILLKIMVQVAVSEFDDNGRRVILYQRQDNSYALYADKMIDMSI